MALICGKWRMYLGICLIVWETAQICGKWRRSVTNDSNNYEGKWLNYLTNGLKMLKMT